MYVCMYIIHTHWVALNTPDTSGGNWVDTEVKLLGFFPGIVRAIPCGPSHLPAEAARSRWRAVAWYHEGHNRND